MPVIGGGWVKTHSFDLNDIDSATYFPLYARLTGRLVDDILLNENGHVIFAIKRVVDRQLEDDNDTYIHELVSIGSPSGRSLQAKPDSLFIDSVINKEWRYTFYKAVTGH